MTVELSTVSGPLALYQVHWHKEELLPLGYTLWTGKVTAESGPGVALLIELYPNGGIPRNVNLEVVIEAVEGLENHWNSHSQWLAEAIESEDLRLLRSFENAHNATMTENHYIDFSTRRWTSADPLNEQIYSGRTRLALIRGELRKYIHRESEEVLVVYLSPSGRLQTGIRPLKK